MAIASAAPSTSTPGGGECCDGDARTNASQIIDVATVQQEEIINQIDDNDGGDIDESSSQHHQAEIQSVDRAGVEQSLLLQSGRNDQILNFGADDNDSENDEYIGDIHYVGEGEIKQQHCPLGSSSMSNGQPVTTSLEPSQTSRIDEDPPESLKQPEHHRMTRLRRRHVPSAVIELDASTAFSPYRPVPTLSFLTENNIALENVGRPQGNTSRGKQSSRRRGSKRDKKNTKRDRNSIQRTDNVSGDASEDNIQIGNTSDTLQSKSHHELEQKIHRYDNPITSNMHPVTTMKVTDPIHYILPDHVDDAILQDYLPQFKFLSDNYYPRVKPYRMGKRNLPLNQLELILRRRAVIKRSEAQKEHATASGYSLDSSPKGKGSPSLSTSRKPPPNPYTPPRRKLFPSTTQHLTADSHDDDSSISSTTIASHLITPVPTQRSIEPTSIPHQPSSSNTTCDTAIAISAIPKEEIIGDTSLGLKLTIIHGKVIIQKITPLDDGRASPAQLCGLLSPGDIIIAVNGKSLIHGTIHNPVPMDKIITVLKPLSQPMDAVTKEYSREVRLRFVLAEGKALLREQEERAKQRAYERDMRKKLGLTGGSSGKGIDPAADLFGIGAFMGVDQHSGMPMFGHLDHNLEEEKKNENSMETADGTIASKDVVSIAPVSMGVSDETGITSIHNHTLPIVFAPARQTVQAQIAHQIHLDRQWFRHRNTSEFFSLSNNAPLLLRQPPPQIDHVKDLDADNSIDARKRRLERGAQVMSYATSLVSVVESQENALESFEDEDPMEVASRVCGTATVRTGASRRRWHRGDSIIAEETSSHAASNYDGGTMCSGESGVEACDHRLLVELAANNESWKMNVLKRLDAFVTETEKENIESLHGTKSDSNTITEESGKAGFDSFLFGGDVAKILGKQKQSTALPPGEMTAMLFDLVELLEGGLPNQIFTKCEFSRFADPPFVPGKVVSFAKHEENTDIAKATDFLLNKALGKWLKSFRPLPWKQRRALWPTHQSGLDGDSIMSSRMDDNDSLSLTSGTTAQTRSPEKHKRNLRELIEQLEIDPETRRETCILVTFFLTRKLRASALPSEALLTLPRSAEDEALALIDAYGCYIDIHTCLVIAGQIHSKSIVDKLLCLAKYDSQHKEAVKALERARTILLYEPSMLSALLDLLPSITKLPSNNVDFIALLVSAYPEVQPWSVREASNFEHCGEFYSKYLLSLLHHEEGNDAAKLDKAMVKEFCSMLCSFSQENPSIGEYYRRCFFHIASRDDPSSEHYYRDLPFLMDCSVKMSEFGLTLSLANEILSSRQYSGDQHVLCDVLQHIGVISNKAIESSEGEVNTVLLGQVISFLSVFSSRMAEKEFEFDLSAELSKLVKKCHIAHENKPQRHSFSNIDACLTAIAENAPPACSLRVLAQWEHSCVHSSTFISAIHAALISGARDGVRGELSGSMLRIQRARDEGRRPMTENGVMVWSGVPVEGEVEDRGSIWSRVLEGTVAISK